MSKSFFYKFYTLVFEFSSSSLLVRWVKKKIVNMTWSIIIQVYLKGPTSATQIYPFIYSLSDPITPSARSPSQRVWGSRPQVLSIVYNEERRTGSKREGGSGGGGWGVSGELSHSRFADRLDGSWKGCFLSMTTNGHPTLELLCHILSNLPPRSDCDPMQSEIAHNGQIYP